MSHLITTQRSVCKPICSSVHFRYSILNSSSISTVKDSFKLETPIMEHQTCKLLAVTVDGSKERSSSFTLKTIPISFFYQNLLAFLYCHGEFWFMSLTVRIQWISQCQFLCTFWYTYNSLSATVISLSSDIPKWQKANHWWTHTHTAYTYTTQMHRHTHNDNQDIVILGRKKKKVKI